MPTLKEYNSKLAALRSTRKMTKIMKMISVTKLRKAQEARRNAKAFVDRFHALIARLAVAAAADGHPLLHARKKPRKALVLLLTSDRGLCGGFNNNLNRRVAQWLSEQAARFEGLELSFCGRKGFLFFRNRMPVQRNYEGLAARPSFDDANRIGLHLRTLFLDGDYDEIYLAYNVFNSAMSQTPVIDMLLPMEADDIPKPDAAGMCNCILEPERAEMLHTMLPRLINLQVYAAMLSNAAGEHGARMVAMENATSNADKLIDRITLLRNRARQASITRELIEIVAGAEALR